MPSATSPFVDLNPPAIDGSHRAPQAETLLRCHRNQLVCPLVQGCVISAKRKQPDADRQGSQPETADEPASEPRRLLRCCVPMPGPESRDRKEQAPRYACAFTRGWIPA